MDHKGDYMSGSTAGLTARGLRALTLGMLVCIAAVGVAACGGSTTATTSADRNAAVKAPAGLVAAGTLTYCSDMSYPPEISIQNGKPVGYDHDIGIAVAKELGLDVQFQQIPFASIIAALQAGKCDAIINSVTITAAREKSVFMVPYGQYGQTLLVPQGNPKHVTGLGNLCGLSVGAPLGSNYIPLLQGVTATCKKSGKSGVDVVGFETDAEGVQDLAQGKLDAYIEDAPPSQLYLERTKGQVQVGGAPSQDPAPMGIVVAKSHPALRTAIAQAVKLLYANGTIQAIYKKWQLPSLSLPNE
jgi:polar amino acid transport system substrate-binding protein